MMMICPSGCQLFGPQFHASCPSCAGGSCGNSGEWQSASRITGYDRSLDLFKVIRKRHTIRPITVLFVKAWPGHNGVSPPNSNHMRFLASALNRAPKGASGRQQRACSS
jgi:hypothetical protein